MNDVLLFSPLSIRGVELRNRIVVPPMHQYSAVKGFPTDWHLMNAGKFAAGGAGLVVVESIKVERWGCGTLGDLGIWDDRFIEPLSRLVNFIKQQNSSAGIQLGHSGRKARATRPWEGCVARNTFRLWRSIRCEESLRGRKKAARPAAFLFSDCDDH
jgi:2,4-dienoyl-CoA reductase-like NADH-dependent reductase (Old Yellow Enzyme family)